MTINAFSIGKHVIGKDKTFIIAEIAQAHDGSIGTAHAYIDAIAEAGADAVKFQTHIAADESTLDEQFRTKFSYQDKTRYDYWKRMEFTKEQWAELFEHAKRSGLVFLSSPFSVKAVEMLNEIGVPAWKVGSGEISTPDIMNTIVETGKPILLSTGMSNYQEIENIVLMLKKRSVSLGLFQCTSLYPTPLEKVGLNLINEFKDRFQCPVGLSDHSGSIYPGLATLAKGVDMLEVHVTFDRRLFGPDVVVSITIDALAMLVKTRNAIHVMDQNPVDKDTSATGMVDTKLLFSKSVAPAKILNKGTVLESNMLMLKKPGSGIMPHEIEKIIGLRLRRNVSPERLLRWDDVELQ
jgi:N-acetylneuraminate synthase